MDGSWIFCTLQIWIILMENHLLIGIYRVRFQMSTSEMKKFTNNEISILKSIYDIHNICSKIKENRKMETQKNEINRYLGYSNIKQSNTMLNLAAKATIHPSHMDEEHVKGLVSLFNDLDTKTPLESMLVSQITALHTHTMRMMKDINSNTCSITAQDAMLGQINKMMRTFVVQAEAFEKLKRGGNQNIKVDHFHVHTGGQAIVGSISSYAGGREHE